MASVRSLLVCAALALIASPLMKPSVMPHVAWALVAVTAFAVGYSVTGRTGAGRAATKPVATPSEARDAIADDDTQRRHAVDLAPTVARTESALTPEEARIRTFEVLGEANRVERMRRLCDLLTAVDATNWREVIDGFSRQTSTSGISRPDEWRLILARIAEVAGRVAIEEALASGTRQDQERVPLLLTGWAAREPKAAIAWLEAQPKEAQAALANSLINGLAQGSPQDAIAFLGAHPEIGNLGSQMIEGLAHGGGLLAGDQLLAAIRGRSDIPDHTKGSIFFNLAMRRLMLAEQTGASASFLNWADGYIGPEFMGPQAAKGIVNFAAQTDATAALKWVDERSDRWTAEHEAVIYPVLAQAMQKQSPEKFDAWMSANRDHPHHDGMVEAATTTLLKRGDIEGARRLVNSAVSPEARTRLEQSLQKAQAAAKGPPGAP